MAKRDGGVAFPSSDIDGMVEEGMSLRDWFAGQALAGSLASKIEDIALWKRFARDDDPTTKDIAELCYMLADSMLREREVDRD